MRHPPETDGPAARDVAETLLAAIPGAAALGRMGGAPALLAANAAFEAGVPDRGGVLDALAAGSAAGAEARLRARGHAEATVSPGPGGLALIRMPANDVRRRDAALMRQILDQIPDLIYAKDREGRFILKNRADAAFMGAASPEETIGRTDFDYYPAELARATSEDDRRVIESDAPVVGKVERLIGHDGEARSYSTTKAPLRDASGRVVGLFGIGRDVTAMSRMERDLRALTENLRRAVQDAEDALEVKSRFLATMSHELRTPLNGVLGLAAVLERSGLDAEQKRIVAAIRESGEALATLVGEIFDLSQIERGALEIAEAAFRPAELASRIEARHGPRAGAAGLRFTLIDGCAPDERRRGDVDRLFQVAGHLIENAVKFAEEGAILVTLCGDDRRLILAVSDDGVGMSAEQRLRAFDLFTQGDSSETRAAGGVGLGLSIVAGLARAMGGGAAIVSAPGAGTTVTVAVDAPLLAEAPRRAAGE